MYIASMALESSFEMLMQGYAHLASIHGEEQDLHDDFSAHCRTILITKLSC